MELVAKNGENSFLLGSDESFKVHPSHIVYDMYRYGTHIDARKEIKGWSCADFDDNSWQNALIAPKPSGEILPSTVSPIAKISEISPIKIEKQSNIHYLKTSYKNGEDVPFSKISGYLYDFGKSTSGVCRLKIRGKAGDKITVRHAERLFSDGSFGINSILTIKDDFAEVAPLFQTDIYTLAGGGVEVFTPPFTYHGFRYAFVEGITDEQATEDLLTYEVLSSELEKRSDFVCSDETLNKLYEMAVNADISNFHYFPTDCPQREKNGWTGDISVSAEQILLTLKCSEELRVWLKMLALSQLRDGSLPCIVPTSGWGYQWGNGPMWDSAAVTVPYYIYKYDGRCDVLFECSDMIYKYLRYIQSRRDDRGLIAVGLGDWCQPRAHGEEIAAPLVLTDSVTVYDIAKKSEFIFSVTGESDREAYARELAIEIRSAVREHLIDFRTMTAVGSCQTSQTVIISHGILNSDEIPAAYQRLIELTHEKDDHLILGMIGLRYVFDLLVLGGDAELALKMICREDEPSYASMICRGATALCEALWENGYNESENHHFLGDIIRIFHSRIAGLFVNPDMNDKNCVCFSPTVVRSLDFAEGRYQFDSGEAVFGWRLTDGGALAYITIPVGVYGAFEYDGRRLELSSGYNEFLIKI